MSLRVGLLGCGNIGQRHATAVTHLSDRMQLVACCGRDSERTESFAAPFGAVPYTDFSRMLGEARLDLLIVTLPPFAHNGEVEAAAKAGVNLLLEKPIALDLDRAASMVEASRNVVAACGFMFRFGAAVERWDQLTKSGETGMPGHFSGSFHCNALHASWWREKEKSGGQMVEQLIHVVDLARHTLGLPQSVFARSANLFHRNVEGYDIEDVSAMLLGFADGRIGVLHASNAAIPGRWAKQWQIVAERMTGIFADFNTAELAWTQGEVRTEKIAATADPFILQLEDVSRAIANRTAPRVPLGDGLDALRIVLAARRSAETGREVLL